MYVCSLDINTERGEKFPLEKLNHIFLNTMCSNAEISDIWR